MRALIPAMAGFFGTAAIVGAVFGLAGPYWALLVAGVLLIVWAVLSMTDRVQ